MDRRTFIGSIAGGFLAVPLDALAQQQGKVWRIGFLYYGSRQSALDTGRYDAFVQGMRELGYTEGKTFIIEARFGDGKVERLPDLATELVRSKVDVVIATGNPAYSALQHATATIPIVITVTTDPVLEGWAASLARPGGNFTGLTSTASYLGPKHLELLMVAVPRLSRFGVLLNPGNPSHPPQMKLLMLTAGKGGVQVIPVQASTVADIESGFASLARERANAVIILGDSFFVQQFQQIAQVGIKYRMPSISANNEYAEAGGLMTYGANYIDNFLRAATFVDKILKGAKAGELPFEQPARYTLAINLKTAKAIGITVPQSLLLRADEVIQ